MTQPTEAVKTRTSILEQFRRAQRFDVKAQIDLTLDGKRHASGRTINVSREGVAFKTVTPLAVGQEYSFHIQHFGDYDGVIVRCIDGQGYAARLYVSDYQKRKLDEKIFKMLIDD